MENQDILTTNEQYQKLIGSLLYISANTRPDIAVQKIKKPAEYDWNKLKRIARYLKGTAHFKLDMFSRNKEELFGNEMKLQIGQRTEQIENQTVDTYSS